MRTSLAETVGRGLYAITDPDLVPDRELAAAVERAIQGGARLIQYRDKRPDSATRMELAVALAAVCRRRSVPLIINDDVALAARVGAAGVHLGRDDADPAAARERLGAAAIVGVSCYDRIERALAAAREDASYVAFGSFYPSATKPGAVRADPALLPLARRRLDLPVAVIGGITPVNAAPLVRAGADWLAVIRGVFGQGDVEAAARAYAQLYPPPARPTPPGAA